RFDCDWSSDVCSSDLQAIPAREAAVPNPALEMFEEASDCSPEPTQQRVIGERDDHAVMAADAVFAALATANWQTVETIGSEAPRSEERREGKLGMQEL